MGLGIAVKYIMVPLAKALAKKKVKGNVTIYVALFSGVLLSCLYQGFTGHLSGGLDSLWALLYGMGGGLAGIGMQETSSAVLRRNAT